MESCRLCFSKGEHFNIFSENGNALGMAQIISDHFKCEVSESDSLPPCVCDKCWSLTETFHNFYESVKSAQNEYLAKTVKTEATDEDVPYDDDPPQRSFLKTSFVECQTILKETDETHADDTDTNSKEFTWQMDHLKSPLNDDQVFDKNFLCDQSAETETEVKKRRKTKQEKASRKAKIENIIAEHSHRFDMNCEKCTVHLQSLFDARKHYLSAHDEPKGYIKCCKVKLKYPSEIVTHINNKHLTSGKHKRDTRPVTSTKINKSTEPKIKKYFACEICNKILTTEMGLRIHLKGHENTTEVENKVHKQFITENFDMSCDLCPVKFESYYDARFHYKDVHDIKRGYIKCCKTKFFDLRFINDHIDFHLNPDSFKCKLCAKKLKNRYHLHKHMVKHERSATNPFICDICGKRFINKEAMATHILAKHAKSHQHFQCTFCEKGYPLEKMLKNHVYTVHTEHPTNICEICGKSFRVKASLHKHMLTHTDKSERLDKRTQCKHCGEWLLTYSGIYYHRKIHTTEPQKCSQCDTVLPNQISLSNHIRSHHREFQHKCNYCEKAFETQYKLKLHLESHTRDKSYPCAYCPIVFKIGASLKTHRRRTHFAEWQRDQPKKGSAKRSIIEQS